MFMTIEDETGVANIVVWPSLYEKQRRVVLGSAMMAINAKIQREGGFVHLVAQRMFDLTSDLASLGERDTFRCRQGVATSSPMAHRAARTAASGRRWASRRVKFMYLTCTSTR